MSTEPTDPTDSGCNATVDKFRVRFVEGRPKLDTKRMRECSPLLPAPGDEVVRECLDEIESLQSALTASRAECEWLKDALRLVLFHRDDIDEMIRVARDAIARAPSELSK